MSAAPAPRRGESRKQPFPLRAKDLSLLPIKLPRQRLARILGLALPIMGAMVSQSVLNLVDTAMVGVLGDAALGAVGLGGFVNSLVLAILLGVSAGVQTIAARRHGEGARQRSALVLNAALLLLLLVAPLYTLALFFAAPCVFPYLSPDPQLQQAVVPYFQVRILAGLFVAANYAFRGYWNAVDRSRIYLATLVGVHLLNILFNYLLIYGHWGLPRMGVTGAGLASALALACGTAAYLVIAWRSARSSGFLRGLPPRHEINWLVQLSLPNGLQQMLFLLGITVMFAIIGQVGTAELAASTAMFNVMLAALLPGFGLALATATLVSQALGRGDIDDADRWNREVMLLGSGLLLVLGLPMWLAPDLLLRPFLHDVATRHLAHWPMRLMGLFVVVDGMRLILMNALLGAGAARTVMLVASTTQWLLGIPLAYLAGPLLQLGLTAIWGSQIVYGLLQAGIFWVIWRNRGWAGKSPAGRP